MTKEEQNALDTAERNLAAANAARHTQWIDYVDAATTLATRAKKNAEGQYQFVSTTPNEDKSERLVDGETAAAELATQKPHWTAATLKPGSAANGNAGTKAPADTMSYADLLKPENAERLKTFIATKPQDLARMRTAYFNG